MLWRRKNKRFTARLNTVVETAEQTRQAFKPREPRVTIDTSFIDQQAATAASDVEALKASTTQTYAPQRQSRLASTHHQSNAIDDTLAPDADVSAGTAAESAAVHHSADGDDEIMSVEEMVAELTELRDLTTLFDTELAKTQADNDALRAAADAKDLEIESLTRDLAASQANPAPAEPAGPDVSALQARIEALSAELAHQREARQAAQTEAEVARKAAEAAEVAAAAAAKASLAVAAPIAVPPAKEVAALKEAMALLKANHEAELLAEQATRRAVEAQKDLAERRLATAQRHMQVIEETAAELARMQAERDEIASRAGTLEAEVARAADKVRALEAKLAAGADIARARDEAMARCATLEAEAKSASERIAQLERDAASMAAAAKKTQDALRQAQSEKSEVEAALAARAAQTEADQAARASDLDAARSALEAERAARASADTASADLTAKLSALEEQIARLRSSDAGLATAAKIEADSQRELAVQLGHDLKAETALRAKVEAELSAAKTRVADLQRRLETASMTEATATASEAELAAIRQARADLEAALADERKNRTAAEKKLTTAEARLADAERQLQSAETSAQRSTKPDETALAALREAVAALEARLAEEEKVRLEAETRLSAAEARIAQTSLEAAKSSSSNRELLASTRREADALRSLVAQLESDLKAEQDAAETARADLDIAHKLIDKLSDGEDAEGLDEDPVIEDRSTPQRSPAFDRDAAFATGPIPLVASRGTSGAKLNRSESEAVSASSPILDASDAAPVDQAEATVPVSSPGKEGRRERRTQAQAPATVWQAGMSNALSCTIRDRSSGGALLEFPRDRHGMGISEFSVGDELTLTFTSYRERSSVRCVVARIEGRTCGVKFAGQFHVELLKPTKPKKPEAGKEPQKLQKPAAASPAKSGLGLVAKFGSKVGRS